MNDYRTRLIAAEMLGNLFEAHEKIEEAIRRATSILCSEDGRHPAHVGGQFRVIAANCARNIRNTGRGIVADTNTVLIDPSVSTDCLIRMACAVDAGLLHRALAQIQYAGEHCAAVSALDDRE